MKQQNLIHARKSDPINRENKKPWSSKGSHKRFQHYQDTRSEFSIIVFLLFNVAIQTHFDFQIFSKCLIYFSFSFFCHPPRNTKPFYNFRCLTSFQNISNDVRFYAKQIKVSRSFQYSLESSKPHFKNSETCVYILTPSPLLYTWASWLLEPAGFWSI